MKVNFPAATVLRTNRIAVKVCALGARSMAQVAKAGGMKLVAKYDVEAPVDFVFAQLADFEGWERAAMRRG